MTQDQLNFVNLITPYVKSIALSLGYNVSVVPAIVAQACIESNWGKSLLASKYYNYFGMKCGSSWNGPSVNMTTKEEYQPGTSTPISANFRVYTNTELGISGYFDFISTTRYRNLKNCTDANDFLEKIKAAGYATSSSYVANIMKIVNQINCPDNPNDTLVKIALEVISGKWGNGTERIKALNSAGYNAQHIQILVNALLTAFNKIGGE